MLHWNAIIWIAILLGIRGIIYWLHIPAGHDFYGLVITTGVMYYAYQQLGIRPQLRSFLLGIVLYWIGSLLDWIDGILHGISQHGQIVDTLDDILYASGFFFMGLAFIRVMLDRDKLEQKLYQQAYLDELTGLGNRRALFEKLSNILSIQSGALLYIDVNLFKQVNDQFGHDRGDLVLRECAALLKQSSGLAYRIGGDEFVLLLSDESPEKICTQLLQQVIPLTTEHGISFSIGVGQFTAKAYENPDALLAVADQAMYAAKQTFRAQHRHAILSEAT